jgi:hypothetical protein
MTYFRLIIKNTMLNNWQKWKLNKFKLKESDIKEIKIAYAIISDGKKKHQEFANFKHYTCECWQLELLWFIEKLWGKCRDCAWFNQ